MAGRYRRSRRDLIAAGTLLAATAVALLLTEPAARTASDAPAPAPVIELAAPATTTAVPLPRASPVALRIPAIGVSTGLVELSLDSSGALKAPDGPDVAGWFAAGPAPGDVGPAVLAGHIDSKAGPAVFFLLKKLRADDEIQVDRSDGRTVVFRVSTVRTFPKSAFPTEEVYGPTPLPELRLVTCGGPFDRAGGRYLDNVIVHAVAVQS